MPWWIGVLEAAEAWGCPPWEIAERDSKVTWYFRYSSYQQTVNKALREKRDKQTKKNRRNG